MLPDPAAYSAAPAPSPLNRPSGRGLPGRITRLRRRRWWPYLAALGPGIIAAAAGNDAGGIATYASTGAQFGYSMLWVMVVITVLLILVQEMCARMGAVTGKGLADLIREQFGLRWAAFATLVFFVANTGVTITEFVGLGAAAELFGIPRWLAVPPLAVLVWWLVTQGSYARVEKLFIALSLVFLSYVVTVFIIQPNWGTIGHALVIPDLTQLGAMGYLSTLVALIGTTITPYMQLYQQASVVEKGVTPSRYPYERFDVIIGGLFSNVVSIFIIIATAATLFVHHQQVQTAADAAKALEPIAGPSAQLLFGVGLFGASMLAAAVLPLATAYAVTEAIGLERGVSFSFRQAPVFMGLFTALVALGAVVAMIPGIPIVALLLFVQVVNGVLLPVELIFILLIANNREVMGRYANTRLFNGVAGLGVAVIILAVLGMLVSLVLVPSG
ncbi:MAG TPA: Nramp family divalent metal transporter [Chloroflexia bacterium]|nr:Nramp family divalent metal transporter [Chloroflexia bacterium]